MIVKEIIWLDKLYREAEVIITDSIVDVVCFSCPCKYAVHQEISTPLNCLDIENIITEDNEGWRIERIGEYEYQMQGQLISKEKGLIRVGGFLFRFEEKRLPGDVKDGNFISFFCPRIDLW